MAENLQQKILVKIGTLEIYQAPTIETKPHACPLCKTLGETKMILLEKKGSLKVRLETEDIVASLGKIAKYFW